MARNGTIPITSDDGDLTPSQESFVAAILRGNSIAAAEAGIGRTTAHRWLTTSEVEAAINRGRRERRQAAEDRIQGLTDKALTVVEKALDEGNARVGIRVLAGLGLLTGEPARIGSDDPSRIARERTQVEGMNAMLQDLLDSTAGVSASTAKPRQR